MYQPKGKIIDLPSGNGNLRDIIPNSNYLNFNTVNDTYKSIPVTTKQYKNDSFINDFQHTNYNTNRSNARCNKDIPSHPNKFLDISTNYDPG